VYPGRSPEGEDDEDELRELQDDLVDLQPALRDAVVLALPFKPVCRDDCPGLCSECGARLADDPDLAAAYRAAHADYLHRRDEVGAAAGVGDVLQIAGVSAGGMPTRVKCLHALVGHALAAGPGVNPLGDEALDAVRGWWSEGPCVDAPAAGPPTAEPQGAA